MGAKGWRVGGEGTGWGRRGRRRGKGVGMKGGGVKEWGWRDQGKG